MAYVRDIMNKHVVTISKNNSCLEAAKLLQEKDISFLVVTEGENPIGIISEADYVRKLVVNDQRASELKVSDIMSNKFRWVEPTTTIEDAVQKMLNNKIRRLVVLEGQKLAGVITQTDLAAHLRSKLLIEETVKSIKN
ncbi:MAG TPA: CBS domain-containing protein [Candidatus Nitrosotenuis sp.]|jgi:CBS domain-containing protein|nr:CBS domain-containing protein [Candidatus Nitrosotenuis sp.]HIH46546.1 CBS domain-containing protein [Candidatus Nitrosotenuis sp.]HIH67886.1 CBS domain-containing protein [Candidatus Nitrosotenuis sp.]HII03480.1 CBS domain-containing protein [Candidatus Nitrosotenuis sp.]